MPQHWIVTVEPLSPRVRVEASDPVHALQKALAANVCKFTVQPDINPVERPQGDVLPCGESG